MTALKQELGIMVYMILVNGKMLLINPSYWAMFEPNINKQTL